uniref:Beta-lactamase n=1 Tax=Candidatus Kentrum sp. TC TaxID=2126339 RepID=A0A450Y9F1_9GAMM|nr:MAG: Beta-lactamase [Candidatus Kentron sp. TC]
MRDGATFHLDLDRPTSTYLTDIPSTGGKGTMSLPAFHAHTVRQLLSHTGCVADYPDKTVPGIADRTTHYATAMSAVRDIWNVGLVTKMSDAGFPEDAPNDGACIIGKTWSYSTPAFTFVAAVLESVTGRAIHRLLQEEIFAPHGLSSMRMKYAASTLPPNDNRASLYDDDNKKVDPANNSWRAFGGGMETDVVDLARFGWKVLDGWILSPEARDNRLWRRVDTIDPGPDYALGWGVPHDTDRGRIAEHPGMSTGGRSLLRIYRDHGLVIAILSNRKNHPVDDVVTLAERIGDRVPR